MQDANAVASRLSKLDPNPEARAAQQEAEQTPAIFKPEPKKKAPPKKAAAQPKVGEETMHLDLGAGYKVTHKPGSGWSAVMRLIAREGNFEEVAATLDSKSFNPDDKAQATLLLSKLFVRKEALEKVVRADAEWKRHCDKRMAALEKRAQEGDKAAQETLTNPSRVKGGEWLGNIREIISTSNGSYNSLMTVVERHKDLTLEQCIEKWQPNKNVEKFKQAGLIFRQFPLKPKKDDPVFVMIFPLKHTSTVQRAIIASRGADY
jgi:hypothetical protein